LANWARCPFALAANHTSLHSGQATSQVKRTRPVVASARCLCWPAIRARGNTSSTNAVKTLQGGHAGGVLPACYSGRPGVGHRRSTAVDAQARPTHRSAEIRPCFQASHASSTLVVALDRPLTVRGLGLSTVARLRPVERSGRAACPTPGDCAQVATLTRQAPKNAI
jgi:hypothetical protein